MVELAPFLETLGLSQYVETFVDSDIDGAALLDLEETHLKELGLSLGHRIRLMKAIAELRAARGASPAGKARTAPTEARGAARRSSADGERRRLTVMFCDLVGSTALASRIDPEDLREVLGAYHAVLAEVVAGLGRYVAKYMGDGVLAHCGYPQEHEHDAEQAVRAGLALIDRVGRLARLRSCRLTANGGT